MPLQDSDIVDAVGIEVETGSFVMTIADEWDWSNEGQHLLALQAKLNGYFAFIESGQLWEVRSDARSRDIVIDVVSRFPMPPAGRELLKRAADVCASLGVKIRSRHHAGPQTK